MTEIEEKRQRELLHDKKWRQFLKRTWLFRYIPFIDFVFASGSIAMGNITEHSDFDVLIAARSGRIFTARFFAAVFFGLFGWRRSRLDHQVSAANKICLNHFVTPETYRLTLEKNEFWKLYYRSLVPLYGQPQPMQKFFELNRDWAGADLRYQADLRHLHTKASWLKKFLEYLLGGKAGAWLERKLKKIQVERIERGLAARTLPPAQHRVPYGEGSRVVEYILPPLVLYTDTELQFHPNSAKLKVFY